MTVILLLTVSGGLFTGEDVKVVALGTGSKCIGQNRMNKEGTCIIIEAHYCIIWSKLPLEFTGQ